MKLVKNKKYILNSIHILFNTVLEAIKFIFNKQNIIEYYNTH